MEKKQSADPDESFGSLRESLIRATFGRIRLSIIILRCLGIVLFVFTIMAMFDFVPTLKWEHIMLFGLSLVCIAFPLFRKVGMSKNGGDVEMLDPIALLQHMREEAITARSESFVQTNQRLAAVSEKVSEIADLVATAGNHNREKKVDSAAPNAGKASEKAEPSLREIARLLPKPTVENDPQKGRFGGNESVGARTLTATVSQSGLGKNWQKVRILLTADKASPFIGEFAYFFVHDTFEPDAYRIKIDKASQSAELEISCYGAFTVGAVSDRGDTMLELDLATSKSVEAPKDWRNR
jgi:hypothetical protein